MKILYVQPYVTFAGILSDTLPGRLADRGHKVTVLSHFRNDEEKKLSSENKNLQITKIPALSVSFPNYVKEFPYFFFLEKVIKEINPDIIHINNLPFLTTYQSTKIARKLRIKNVVQVHGVIGANGFLFDRIQETFLHTLGHSVFGNSDGIICLTQQDSEKIQKFGCPYDKIRIIPNGVDVQKYHPIQEETQNSLLWCGRFVRQKGLKYLIEAMRFIVKDKGRTEIKLFMTGNGPLFQKIFQMVENYGLSSNVVFLGLVPRQELPTIMSKCSVFVLPSLNEGMPYVLLEAMACGKAVIGSDISGINNVISHGENGFIVPPLNPEKLASAIYLLLANNNLRNKLGANARNLMTEKYNWSKITRRMEEFYNETVNN